MAEAPEARADTPSPVPMSDEEDDASAPEEEYDDASTHAEDEPAADDRRKPRDYRHLRIKATPDLPLLSDPTLSPSYREIGHLAHWSLSSSKPGNGVDQLRDSSLETYWQSDGLQPHHINIQFPRRQSVSAVALYMDFNLDESYTPKRMKIKTGTTFHNLEEVRTVEVREPTGWCVIPLWKKWGEDVLDTILDPDRAMDHSDDDGDDRGKRHVPVWKRKPLRTHFVQIAAISMHQNGRDTHVRQVKVFGPRDDDGFGGSYGFGSSCRGLGAKGDKSGGKADMMLGSGRAGMPSFQSVGLSQFSSIR